MAFMAWTVFNAHYPALFIGGFLFFLGFARATAAYQSRIELRTPLLVGFFLAGLVIHGGLQGWWIAPVLGSLTSTPLFFDGGAPDGVQRQRAHHLPGDARSRPRRAAQAGGRRRRGGRRRPDGDRERPEPGGAGAARPFLRRVDLTARTAHGRDRSHDRGGGRPARVIGTHAVFHSRDDGDGDCGAVRRRVSLPVVRARRCRRPLPRRRRHGGPRSSARTTDDGHRHCAHCDHDASVDGATLLRPGTQPAARVLGHGGVPRIPGGRAARSGRRDAAMGPVHGTGAERTRDGAGALCRAGPGPRAHRARVRARAGPTCEPSPCRRIRRRGAPPTSPKWKR